jgi:hypothetical protein
VSEKLTVDKDFVVNSIITSVCVESELSSAASGLQAADCPPATLLLWEQ